METEEVAVRDEEASSKCGCCASTKAKLLIGMGVLLVFGGVAIVIVVMMGRIEGKSLGIPLVRPPVDESTPQGFQPTRRNLQGFVEHTPLSRLQDHVFEYRYDDPTVSTLTYRVYMVDERMESLEARALESARKCIDETPKSWTPAMAFPDNREFPMWFQCEEVLNNESKMFFGIKDGIAYVAEIQDYSQSSESAPSMAVLAEVAQDESLTRIWEIHTVYDGTMPTSSFWKEIVATKTLDAEGAVTASQLEVSIATTASGDSGIGCGIRLKADLTNVWSRGEFSDMNCGTTIEDICLDSVNLNEVADSECNHLTTFDVADMTQTNLLANSFDQHAYDLITSYTMPSLTDFNTDAN